MVVILIVIALVVVAGGAYFLLGRRSVEGAAPAVEAPPVDEAADTPGEAEIEIPGEADGPDWEFVEMVIGELKQRLDSMGPVNLDAIEEFEALEERYTFLEKEHDDLVKSKEHLHKVISKINRETKSRFADTFEQVRNNFRRVFKELFGDQSRADQLARSRQ